MNLIVSKLCLNKVGLLKQSTWTVPWVLEAHRRQFQKHLVSRPLGSPQALLKISRMD